MDIELEKDLVDIKKRESVELEKAEISPELVKGDLSGEVSKKEFSIVGDNLYASVNTDEAPQWLTNIIDSVIDIQLEAGLVSLNQARESILQAIDEIEIAKNEYQELINIEATIDSVIASKLSTLNATVDTNSASILDLDATKVTEDQALALASDQISAELNSGAIRGEINRLDTTIADTNATLASTTDTLSANFDGLAGAQSTLENTVIVNAEQAEANFSYNSTLNIGNTYYNSGFGIKTNLSTGGSGTETDPYDSQFWVKADRFMLDGKLIVGDPASNIRYSYIDNNTGEIGTYEYINGAYREYKSLKRKEYGEAESGITVDIPGYFLTKPYILVSPKVAPVYDVAYKDQSQTYTCSATEVTEFEEGRWRFKPRLDLTLSNNVTTTLQNLTENTSNNSYITVPYVSPSNTTEIEVDVDLGSVRGTGTAGSYYYREVAWRVGYATSSTGIYTWSPFRTVNMGTSFETIPDSTTVSLPSSGVWYVKIEYVASDAGGTFSTGSSGYEYDSVNLSTNDSVSLSTSSDEVLSDYIDFNSYSPPSGWDIYEVTYSGYVSWDISAYGSYTVTGSVYVSVPEISFSESVSSSGAGVHSSGSDTFSRSVSTSSFDNSWLARLEVYSGNGSLDVSNCTALVKIRKALTNSTTPSNTFTLISTKYTLNTTQVLATGVLNWIAIE